MGNDVADLNGKGTGEAEGRTGRRPEGWFLGRTEAWIKGWPEGWAEKEIAVARRALALGLSLEAASSMAELPADVVRKLADPAAAESAWAEGWVRGRAKVKYATAVRALALNCSAEVASKVADLPVDAVRKIAGLRKRRG